MPNTDYTTLDKVNLLYADAQVVEIRYSRTSYSASYYHVLTIKDTNPYSPEELILTLSLGTCSPGSGTERRVLSEAEKMTLQSHMSEYTSINALYTLITYSDSTMTSKVGESSALGGISIRRDYSSPVFNVSAFEYRDILAATKAITGNDQILIQGESNLEVDIPQATARNGAEISEYKISIGSAVKVTNTHGAYSFGVVDSKGTISIEITAKDTRGYTAKISVPITVIPYTKIKINAAEAYRINAVESSVALSMIGSFSPVYIDSTAKNSISGAVYRVKSGTTYSAWIPLTVDSTDTGFSFSTTELKDENGAKYVFNGESTYTIEAKVSDALNDDSVTITIQKAIPGVTFRDGNIGIKTINPSRPLDVVGDIGMNGYRILGYCGSTPDDLNNCTEAGIFICMYPLDTANVPNTSIGGFLMVLNGTNYIMQIYFGVDSSHTIYIRHWNKYKKWSSWTQK